MKIYHNPRCSKSRQTLSILEENGVSPEIVKYLEKPLSYEELKSLIKRLGINPEELVRKNETIYKEKYKGKSLSDEEWIKAMTEHPKLIQRPVVTDGTRAVVGRPPENVLDLIN